MDDDTSGVMIASALDGGHALDLPAGVHVADVARACRAHLLDVLAGVEAGWGASEYEAWVAGPYREITRFAADPESTSRGLRGRTTTRARAFGMRSELFARILSEARHMVVRTLRAAAPPERDSSFAVQAVRKGLVLRARDEQGSEGWVPVDVPNLWPVERLLSLVAADYLTRPRDYELACTAPLAMLHLAQLAVRDGAG